MNTLEIESLLRDLPHFRGVFASNQIPILNPNKFPQAIVINLDPHYMPGSHWVAAIMLQKGRQKVLQFFDSYGMKPPFPKSKKKWTLIHNPTRFQKPKSTVCGHYCVYFVRERLKGKSFLQILKDLRKKETPDNYVKNYVQNLLKKKRCEIFRCKFPSVCQSCKPAPKKGHFCCSLDNLKSF